MVYLITYDLNKTGQDYKSLYDAIKSLGAWAHYLDSTWFVDTTSSASEIRDKLIATMDKNDSLFVSRIAKNYAGWLKEEAWTWLTKHVTD